MEAGGPMFYSDQMRLLDIRSVLRKAPVFRPTEISAK